MTNLIEDADGSKHWYKDGKKVEPITLQVKQYLTEYIIYSIINFSNHKGEHYERYVN